MDTIKSKQARSFVTIMIVIAFCALFLRIIIEQIIKITMTQNESQAQATLKLISTALENYAKDKAGVFPTNLSVLTQTEPPYLDKDYITQSSLKGYNYDCSRLDSLGYSCSAIPAKCKLTGRMNYSVTTGGFFVAEECNRTE